MRIRLPGKKRRWVHVSFRIMCILAILTAIIVTIWGLPAIMEFPLALIAVAVYAIYAYHENKHRKDRK